MFEGEERKYKVKFKYIYCLDIINFIGPENGLFGIIDEKQRLRKAEIVVSKRNSRDNFYNNLRKSIMESGVRNPIIVKSGDCNKNAKLGLAKYLKRNYNKSLICDVHGGSRLWICQQLCRQGKVADLHYKGINVSHIPCIVLDYNDRYKYEDEIEDIEIMMSYFCDLPKQVEFNDYDVWIKNLPKTEEIDYSLRWSLENDLVLEEDSE